jgi:hypothetical protein
MRHTQPSKRRWKARAKAGKWLPIIVVLMLDNSIDLTERWELHPEDQRFMRLRKTNSPQNNG